MKINHTIKTKHAAICFGRIDVTPAPNLDPTARTFAQSHTRPVAYVTGVNPHDQHYVGKKKNWTVTRRKGASIPAWKSPVLRDSSKLW